MRARPTLGRREEHLPEDAPVVPSSPRRLTEVTFLVLKAPNRPSENRFELAQEALKSDNGELVGFMQLAHDSSKDERCLVKYMKKDWVHLNNEDLTAGVLRQRKLSRNQHPHILEFREVISTPSYVGVITEDMPGESLLKFIVARGGRLNLTACRFLFQQVMTTVQYCHQSGEPLCSICPDMFLTQSCWHAELPVIKLCDFQFGVRSSGRKPRGTERQLHKLLFMAPEQLAPLKEGSAPRPAAEEAAAVFSCGALLWMLIFGTHPYLPACRPCSGQPQPDGVFKQLLASFLLHAQPPDVPRAMAAAAAGSGQAAECDSALQLLGGMLARHPLQRLTVSEVMAHPWFVKYLPAEAAGINHRHLNAAPERNRMVQSEEIIREVIGHASGPVPPRIRWSESGADIAGINHRAASGSQAQWGVIPSSTIPATRSPPHKRFCSSSGGGPLLSSHSGGARESIPTLPPRLSLGSSEWWQADESRPRTRQPPPLPAHLGRPPRPVEPASLARRLFISDSGGNVSVPGFGPILSALMSGTPKPGHAYQHSEAEGVALLSSSAASVHEQALLDCHRPSMVNLRVTSAACHQNVHSLIEACPLAEVRACPPAEVGALCRPSAAHALLVEPRQSPRRCLSARESMQQCHADASPLSGASVKAACPAQECPHPSTWPLMGGEGMHAAAVPSVWPPLRYPALAPISMLPEAGPAPSGSTTPAQMVPLTACLTGGGQAGGPTASVMTPAVLTPCQENGRARRDTQSSVELADTFSPRRLSEGYWPAPTTDQGKALEALNRSLCPGGNSLFHEEDRNLLDYLLRDDAL